MSSTDRFKDIPEPPEGAKYHELIKWLMDKGVRPPGDPNIGVKWRAARLAEAKGVEPRAVYFWRHEDPEERTLPPADFIELTFIGPETSQKDKKRERLRTILRVARKIAEDEQAQRADRRHASTMAARDSQRTSQLGDERAAAPGQIFEVRPRDLTKLQGKLGGWEDSAREAALLVYDWFDSSADHQSKEVGRLADSYVLLRRSLRIDTQFVKSSLDVQFDREKKILCVVHQYVDRYNEPRVSRGFVFEVNGNVHLILRVEQGSALEIISFMNPIRQNFTRMTGFMQSVTNYNGLLPAQVLIERNDAIWEALPSRFTLEDLNDYPDRKEGVLTLLDPLKMYDVGV